MWESETDYRLVQGQHKARGVYFIGDESKGDFEEMFRLLTKQPQEQQQQAANHGIQSTSLVTQGRRVHIPRASVEYGVARFTFDELCKTASGAADYLIIGEHFHTIFIQDIPKLTMTHLNLVRRFIILIDAMYECHVKLIVHAATPPQGIFQVDLNDPFCDEVFAFDRTRSRLEEMGSKAYLRNTKQ
jgi:predicted ATPase